MQMLDDESLAMLSPCVRSVRAALTTRSQQYRVLGLTAVCSVALGPACPLTRRCLFAVFAPDLLRQPELRDSCLPSFLGYSSVFTG